MVARKKRKYIGNLEKIENLNLKGWVYNRENLNEKVKIAVLVDGKPVLESIADSYREDLHELEIGDGRYGFDIKLPEEFADGKEHEIRVVVKKTGKDINNSPQIILLKQNLSKQQYIGFLDATDGSIITGWAYNRAFPEEKVELILLIDGKQVAELTADQFREDLKKAGIGDGKHAFKAEIPEEYADGKEHEVRVVVKRIGKDVEGSPRKIILQPSGDYIGNLDGIEGLEVKGWAYNKANPEERVEVVVYVDGKPVAEGVADQFREDLKEAGIGDGRHGFSIRLPDDIVNDEEEHEVRIVVKKTRKDLEGSPKFVKFKFIDIDEPQFQIFISKNYKRKIIKPQSKHAAITIISKNYFSYAKTLAESYKAHHPKNDFIIILVDKRDNYFPEKLECGAEVIEIMDLPIPDLEKFIYRYTILELNTAVKPYALNYLFEKGEYETLVYLDPDIWIFEPLREVYKALKKNSIVLTPHMRRPFYDNFLPSDENILVSGTYNLGFIGLKRTQNTRKLLDWWMEKLFLDCVVDISKGLFVDQKWIDFVPAFFPDYKIIYHPGYNVAYWNLHERKLTFDGKKWFVDGKPLVFFHFSGYSPLVPHQLSKHQNRIKLEDNPALKILVDKYREKLLENGYEESYNWPYAFETLPNKVKLPLNLVRDIMQWACRNNIPVPSPLSEPDEFCKFIMSKGIIPERPNVVLLYYFLLLRRPDVAQAYPDALLDSNNPGFRTWLTNSGVKEIDNLENMFQFENKNQDTNYVFDIFYRLRSHNRNDILEAFKDIWKDYKIFQNFVKWLYIIGPREGLNFGIRHVKELIHSYFKLFRILNIYFLRGDLQKAFPCIWKDNDRRSFINWLKINRYEFELSLGDIFLFEEYLRTNSDIIQKMCFLYSHFNRQHKLTPNIYDVEEIKRLKNLDLSTQEIIEWLLNETSIEPVDHFVAKYSKDVCFLSKPQVYISNLSPEKNYKFIKKIEKAFVEKNFTVQPLINVAGFFSAPSGMGESSRSMLLTLEKANVRFRKITFPHPRAMNKTLTGNPVIFGWPSGIADLSITIANPDTKHLLEYFLPPIYWAKKNIGYWVWETEELPLRYKESEEFFDEIWTPSNYSALAISRTINKPVKVLPHAINFTLIDKAKADRKKFKLPEDGILFGFIFDPESILERKNVAGLINSFKMAFKDDDKCYLILKINGTVKTIYEFEKIKAIADWDKIIFIKGTWSREETYNFMKSLDVYVSLHRSEGFGLTCAESMALGLPVIATGYSGNLDFMDKENSILIPAKVIETERPYGPYPAGTKWGDPDLEAAAEAMRKMLDKEFREHLGKKAKEDIRKKLAPEVVAGLAKRMLKEVLK